MNDQAGNRWEKRFNDVNRFPKDTLQRIGFSLRSHLTAKVLLLTALLFPLNAWAHEGESKGPWIDFSQYGFDG